MLDPGDPNYNLERAKTFFTEMAQRHKDKTNVLYEIANEPSGIEWSQIKSYAEEIIPVIREQDPDSVVLVGTRAWSSLGVSEDSNEQEIVDNPVNSDNSCTRSTSTRPPRRGVPGHVVARGRQAADVRHRVRHRVRHAGGRRRRQRRLRHGAAVRRPDGPEEHQLDQTGTTPTTPAPARCSRRGPATTARTRAPTSSSPRACRSASGSSEGIPGGIGRAHV